MGSNGSRQSGEGGGGGTTAATEAAAHHRQRSTSNIEGLRPANSRRSPLSNYSSHSRRATRGGSSSSESGAGTDEDDANGAGPSTSAPHNAGLRLSSSTSRTRTRPAALSVSQGHRHHGRGNTARGRHSMPIFVMAAQDLECPVCHKTVPSDDAEVHLVMCLTRPRLTYNDDILTEAKGECAICLDDMEAGDTIARLPCLCIYHKKCIDDWFMRKNSCPEHPGED